MLRTRDAGAQFDAEIFDVEGRAVAEGVGGVGALLWGVRGDEMLMARGGMRFGVGKKKVG